MNNPPRTIEEKQQQRDVAREKRRANRPNPAHINRFSAARAIACDQLNLRYRPVPAPRTEEQLRAVLAADPNSVEKARRVLTPDSFEILTEPLR